MEAYGKIYPELLRDAPDVNRSNVQAAVDLVLLLQELGEDDSASTLAERTLPVLDRTPVLAVFGKSLLEVELHAILGNRNKAIEALSGIVELGWNSYVSPNNPNLSSISDDPEFLRLMDVIQERVDAELARVRQMEKDGRLARTPDELSRIDFDLEV